MTTKAVRTVVAAGCMLLPLWLAACGHPDRSGNSSAAVTLAFCGGKAQPRPTVVNVICQTNDITARKLAWTAWGKSAATAIGTAVVDLCAFEDCHTSDYTPVPIVLIASKIATCPRHQRAYTRLQYVFVGKSPFQGVPADVSFKHFISGQGRPGPPRNQTVSLAC
jgi:hypothetical protein